MLPLPVPARVAVAVASTRERPSLSLSVILVQSGDEYISDQMEEKKIILLFSISVLSIGTDYAYDVL